MQKRNKDRYLKVDNRKHLIILARALGVSIEILKERGRIDEIKRSIPKINAA